MEEKKDVDKKKIENSVSKEEIIKFKENIIYKISPKTFGDLLLRDYQFKYDNFNRFWVFNKKDGIWYQDAEFFIKSLLRHGLNMDLQNKKFIDEIIEYLKGKSWTREMPEDTDINLIAFKNCIYDLNQDKFIEFSPKYFLTSKINMNIDTNIKECPLIDNFFEIVSPTPEQKEFLYELASYCFYRSYPAQLIFILHGGGENGKSTYSDLLIHALGINNVSTETPQDLTNKDFSKGSLWKKYANVSAELPYKSIESTNTLKSLCGGDLITCNQKHKTPFPFRNHAKLIFTGNELPQINDNTYAIARRLAIIKFDKPIQNPIKDFINLIITETELSGLAYKCLEALKRLHKNSFTFSIKFKPDEMYKLYCELSNPLEKFINEECLIESKDIGRLFIPKIDFYNSFSDFCSKRKFRVWSTHEVNKEMLKNYNESTKILYDSNGNNNNTKIWTRITLKEKVEDLTEQPPTIKT